MDEIIKKDALDILQRVNVEKLKEKTVFITGATGLIGTYLCYVLYWANKKEGLNSKVIGFSKDKPQQALTEIARDENFTFLTGDLVSDFENISEDIHYIIHGATYAQPQKFLEDKLTTIKLNTEVTEKLLKLAEQKKATFLFLSSSEIYGQPDPANIPTPETYFGNCSTTSERASYAESKRLGETLCSVFKETKGVDVKIARASSVYGPGISLYDKRVLGNFLNKAFLQKHIELLDQGEQERAWCYSADCVVMLLHILLYGTSLVYNVGGKHPISIKKLAEMICELTGASYALPKNKQEVSFLKSAPLRVEMDITKVTEEFNLGDFVDIKSGLTNVIEWNRNVIQQHG